MGLVGAGLGLFIGRLIDKIGSKSTLILTAFLVVGHAFMLGLTEHLWQNTTFVRTMLAFWVMLTPLVMVSIIALGMSVCSSKVSATQFAIYMSTANLGSSLGAKVFGKRGQEAPKQLWDQLGWKLQRRFLVRHHSLPEMPIRYGTGRAGGSNS